MVSLGSCFHSGVVTLVTDLRGCVYSPVAQTSVFSMPAPDAFGASFSLETGLDVSNDSQDSPGQFDLSLIASESSVSDFDASFDVDIPAWNKAVFGEFPSQQSTSSSSSSWEEMSQGEPSMETSMDMGIDMQLQFPIVKVDVIGDGTGMPTEDEFLRAIMEAVQSSPRTVSSLSYFILPSGCAQITSSVLILFGLNQLPVQGGFELFRDAGDFNL